MSTAPQDNATFWIDRPENAAFWDAALVYRSIPQTGHFGFNFIDAMIFVGISPSDAYTSDAKVKLQVIVESLEKQHGPPTFENSLDDRLKRTERLLKLNRGTHLKSKKLTDVMRLAGCDLTETKPGNKYMRFYRMSQKLLKAPPLPPTQNHRVVSPTPPVASVATEQRRADPPISPLSLSGASSSAAPMRVPSLLNFQQSTSRRPPDVSVASLLTNSTTSTRRKTTATAQQERTSRQEEKLLYSAIQSRGIEPPSGKKEVFITRWEQVKGMPVIKELQN
jgi:hypothetical protein